MTFPLLLGARQDHGLHMGKAILFHEHVLRTTQADALRPKLSAFGRILRVVRISTNTQSSNCVRPLKYLFKIFIDLRWDQFSLAQDLSLIHISEPTRRTPISYAVFCLKKKKKTN